MSDFVGSSISSDVLRQHLRIVSRSLLAGEVPDEASRVYRDGVSRGEDVYLAHDRFLWTLNHLHPAGTTLAALMADSDRLDHKMTERLDRQQRLEDTTPDTALQACITHIRRNGLLETSLLLPCVAGVAGLGLAVAGLNLAAEIVGLGGTIIALGCGLAMERSEIWNEHRPPSQGFCKELEAWGTELSRQQAEQDRKYSATAMLSLDEKRAVLRELEASE